MRPKRVTLTPQSDADGISLSQTPAAGGAQNLTITGALASGGAVTLNHGHLLIITSVADETGRTFTVTGTDYRGTAITEAIMGANAGVATGTKYFKGITQISVDADTTGAVTVGVSGLCASGVYLMDRYQNPVNIGFTSVVSDTLTYTVQHTSNDIQIADLDNLTWFNHDSIAAKTTSEDGNFAFASEGIRVIVTAFTGGTLQFEFTQSG